MDVTRELIDAEAVGRVLAAGSLVALLLAPALLLVGSRKPCIVCARAGLAAAGAAVVWPLWAAYNAVVERLGLDSIAALVVNLALFVTVGALAGLGLRRWWPAAEGPENEGGSRVGESVL